MTTAIAVVAALGSAASSATASALQHRSASDAEPAALPTTGLRGFVHSQLTHRLWWTALPFQAVGLVLHATALGVGALALVQPLLVCSVVLALPVNRYLHRQSITARELAMAALLVVGVAGFLTISAAGPPSPNQAGGPAVVAAVLAGAGAIAVCWVLARRARPVHAAALLSTGAAIAFTGQAAFLQATTAELPRGLFAVLGSGAFYGLLVCGATGVLLTQLAFRAGPLVASLPIITILNPLLGIAVGVVIDHETLRHSPVALVGEVLMITLLSVAAMTLSRWEAHTAGDRREPSVT